MPATHRRLLVSCRRAPRQRQTPRHRRCREGEIDGICAVITRVTGQETHGQSQATHNSTPLITLPLQLPRPLRLQAAPTQCTHEQAVTGTSASPWRWTRTTASGGSKSTQVMHTRPCAAISTNKARSILFVVRRMLHGTRHHTACTRHTDESQCSVIM